MARSSAADTAEGLFVLASLLAITNSSWSTESITLRAVFVFVAVLNYRTPVDAALSCCAFRKASSSGLLLGCFSPVLLLGAITAAGAPRIAGAHFWSLLGCALQLPLASLMPRSSWHALILGAPPTWLVFALLRPAGADAALMLIALVVHGAFLVWALTLVKGSFTLGEAATLAQGAALLVSDMWFVTACASPSDALARQPFLLSDDHTPSAQCAPRSASILLTEALLAGGLCLTAILGLLLSTLLNAQRVRPYAFAAAIAVALGGVLLPWLGMLVDSGKPLTWLLHMLLGSRDKWYLLGYWLVLIPIACWLASKAAPSSSTPKRDVKARLLLARKVYHFLTVALFCPAILLQPDLLRHCLAIAIVLFALLELIRCFRLPPLAEHLDAFLSTFIDSRDSGTLILTHIYLLLGCGLPIWLAPAATAATSNTSNALLAAAPHAGVLVLGVGDAFASLVGVHFGKRKWPQSKKTFEGTAAAIVSMMALLALLLRHHEVSGMAWGWLLGCTMVACALEALTEQIDNLFLPVAYMACLLLAAACSG